jgi:hypothetical protein
VIKCLCKNEGRGVCFEASCDGLLQRRGDDEEEEGYGMMTGAEREDEARVLVIKMMKAMIINIKIVLFDDDYFLRSVLLCVGKRKKRRW